MRRLLLVLPLVLCAYAQAETVFLKDGQSVVGAVLWRGRSGIEMLISEGCVNIGQKVFIDARTIETVGGYCAECEGGVWGINEVAESRLEFEKRMKVLGRVFYKDRWVSMETRDADEARIKAEKEKAAVKEAPAAPLTPATPRSAAPSTPAAPRSTTPPPAPMPGPAGTPGNPANGNTAAPNPAPAPAPGK